MGERQHHSYRDADVRGNETVMVAPLDRDEVLKALAWLKREKSHYECEDCWYSCATICCDEHRTSDKCDCGANEENQMKRTLLAYLESFVR
jgi:hypothetical protein